MRNEKQPILTKNQRALIKEEVTKCVYPSTTDLAKLLDVRTPEGLQAIRNAAYTYRIKLFPDKQKRNKSYKSRKTAPITVMQTYPHEVLSGVIQKPSLTPMLIRFLKWRFGVPLALEDLCTLTSWLKNNAPDFQAELSNEEIIK